MIDIKALINQYPSINVKRILNQIETYTYISFDIFDTLVKRKCGKPENVFSILGKEFCDYYSALISPEKFQELRMKAEQNARNKAKENGNQEISIYDIYESNLFDEFSELQKNWLITHEINLEKTLCIANRPIVDIYHECLVHGKKISIISDMYLPEEVIVSILDSCGIHEYEKLYLSSSLNAQKLSGKLYSIYLSDIQQDGKECLHIGDSIKGDFIAAIKVGIKSIRIPRDTVCTRFNRRTHMSKKSALDWTELQKCQNSCINPAWNDYFVFGYECLGPFYYGICKWLYNKIENNHEKKMFFLSRDGYAIQKCFNELYPNCQIENKYLYVSRRGMLIPQYWISPGLEEFQKSAAQNVIWTYSNISEQLGISEATGREAWRKAGLSDDDYVYNRDLLNNNKIKIFYNSIEENVMENSKKSFTLLIEYFQQNGFFGNAAIFDVGWGGTMQKCMDKILTAASIPSQITGYYIGLKSNAYKSIKANTFFMPGYMPNVAAAMMFDFFFTAPEGSVKTYEKDKNSAVIPVLYDCEYDTKEIHTIKTMFAGTQKFCRDMKDCHHFISMNNENYSVKMLNAIRYPRMLELDMFSNITFTDKDKNKMAMPDNYKVYIRDFKTLQKDFWQSGWKVGFLRKLIKLPLPYYNLYSFLLSLKERER